MSSNRRRSTSSVGSVGSVESSWAAEYDVELPSLPAWMGAKTQKPNKVIAATVTYTTRSGKSCVASTYVASNGGLYLETADFTRKRLDAIMPSTTGKMPFYADSERLAGIDFVSASTADKGLSPLDPSDSDNPFYLPPSHYAYHDAVRVDGAIVADKMYVKNPQDPESIMGIGECLDTIRTDVADLGRECSRGFEKNHKNTVKYAQAERLARENAVRVLRASQTDAMARVRDLEEQVSSLMGKVKALADAENTRLYVSDPEKRIMALEVRHDPLSRRRFKIVGKPLAGERERDAVLVSGYDSDTEDSDGQGDDDYAIARRNKRREVVISDYVIADSDVGVAFGGQVLPFFVAPDVNQRPPIAISGTISRSTSAVSARRLSFRFASPSPPPYAENEDLAQEQTQHNQTHHVSTVDQQEQHSTNKLADNNNDQDYDVGQSSNDNTLPDELAFSDVSSTSSSTTPTEVSEFQPEHSDKPNVHALANEQGDTEHNEQAKQHEQPEVLQKNDAAKQEQEQKQHQPELQKEKPHTEHQPNLQSVPLAIPESESPTQQAKIPAVLSAMIRNMVPAATKKTRSSFKQQKPPGSTSLVSLFGGNVTNDPDTSSTIVADRGGDDDGDNNDDEDEVVFVGESMGTPNTQHFAQLGHLTIKTEEHLPAHSTRSKKTQSNGKKSTRR